MSDPLLFQEIDMILSVCSLILQKSRAVVKAREQKYIMS